MNAVRLLFFFKFYDVADFAIQGEAQGIQCFGADGFTFFDAVESVGRETLFENQIVFRYALFKKCFIKWFVTDHIITRYCCICRRLLFDKILS